MSVEGDYHLRVTSGEIYLETDDGYFPCPGWSDRVLPAISHWIGNALMIRDPTYGAQTVTNYCMDGPYSFEMQKHENDHVIIRCLKRLGESEPTEELPAFPITCAEYCDALLSLTENILHTPGFQWLETEHMIRIFEQSVAKLRARL